MSAQELIPIPKENYIKNQPKASKILDDPTIIAKSQQLTVLQRNPEKRSQRREKRPKKRRHQRPGKISKKGSSLNLNATYSSNREVQVHFERVAK